MILGISRIGAYIPRLRLARGDIARAWGANGGAGERAVASYDEDSLTMAVDATLNCLGWPPYAAGPDAVYFASTTAPYAEKQSSTTVAAVCELANTTFTADFGSSLRGATAATRAALDAVAAGSATKALVVAADARQAPPGSPLEPSLSDGAACVEVAAGSTQLAAVLLAAHSTSEEFLDVWRRSDDEYLNPGDTLFNRPHGYVRVVAATIRALLEKANIAPESIARVALNAPDARSYSSALQAAGFPADSCRLPFPLGDSGAAAPLIALVQALEQSTPGDLVLFAGYGSGNCDAMLLRVTPAVDRLKDGRGVAYHLSRQAPLSDYLMYLRIKGALRSEKLQPYSSPALLWKEQKQGLLLYGVRCRRCAAFAFPRRGICLKCGAKDDFADAKLARTGTIFSFAIERLFPTPGPTAAMAVVDMDGGGKFYAQVIDCVPEQLAIGQRLELCLRKMHEGGDYHNYFWKFRPA